MTMVSDVKKEWIAALRSDEFKQTTGQLKTDSGFCCLGVLCELYMRKHGGEWTRDNKFENYSAALPYSVREWAGLHSGDPIVSAGGAREPLSNANDVLKYPFSKIADIIEEQL